MSQVTLNWNDRALAGYLEAISAISVAKKRELLDLLGQQLVGFTREHFQERGPGWAPKSPLFAYWEGGKDAPLTYSGQLAQSIEHEVASGDTVRWGSNKPYAATQQYGTDGPRSVVFHIIPEMEPGERGKERIARFENGFPKGKLDPTRRDPRAVKVLMRINIVPRPFVREPDAAESGRLEQQVVDYVERIGGRAA